MLLTEKRRAPVRHKQVIQMWLRRHPECRTSGFTREMNEITDWPDGVPHIMPDAFAIHADLQEVMAFEVEETYPLSSQKLQAYCDIWWALDYVDWNIGLILVSRWGTPMLTLGVGKLAAECIRRGLRPGEYPDDMTSILWEITLAEQGVPSPVVL